MIIGRIHVIRERKGHYGTNNDLLTAFTRKRGIGRKPAPTSLGQDYKCSRHGMFACIRMKIIETHFAPSK